MITSRDALFVGMRSSIARARPQVRVSSCLAPGSGMVGSPLCCGALRYSRAMSWQARVAGRRRHSHGKGSVPFYPSLRLTHAVLCVYFQFRTFSTWLLLFTTNFNWKERLFVALAWMPKADVQVNAHSRKCIGLLTYFGKQRS